MKNTIDKILLIVAVIDLMICSMYWSSSVNKNIVEHTNKKYEIKQDQLEDTISKVIEELFTDNNKLKYNDIRDYITEAEYTSIIECDEYKDDESTIVETNIYSCRSKYNSNDIEEEIVDIKVQYGDYNRMYLIKFGLSSNNKITSHEIYVY